MWTAFAWLRRVNHHRLLGWGWVLLTVPALLWWKDSILFVILMSIYANAEASFSAAHAKDANGNGKPDPEDGSIDCG